MYYIIYNIYYVLYIFKSYHIILYTYIDEASIKNSEISMFFFVM